MDRLRNFIDHSTEEIIALQTLLTAVPAVSPENGGDGEFEKARCLKEELTHWGFDRIEEIFVPDERVSSKQRPSLLVTIKGKSSSKAFWIISHLDVVPAGELSLWDTNPFQAVVKGDRVYGRGTEDNQQGIVASLIAAKALLTNKIQPSIDIKLLFVADEEMGSEYGIAYLLDHSDLFRKEDLILTPDVGDPQGDFIEVAEKSILWLEFSIVGKQAHGSRPDHGINAARVSSELNLKLDQLYKIFDYRDPKFDVPYSTFEPTKRVGTVTNFNTIPGREILCYDCRILPHYPVDEVIAAIQKILSKVEQETGSKITYQIVQRVDAPTETPESAEIVQLLVDSIQKVLHKTPRAYGIGGGTVAAYFRMRGYDAALWSTLDNTMHSPNEYSSLFNTKQDAAVFAEMMVRAE